MKSLFLISSLTLSVIAAPAFAGSQDQQAGPEITVSAKYQKDWTKGNKVEAEGLQEIAKAKRELVKHSAEVVNAQNLRDNSQAQAQNAREAFDSLTARPYFTKPDEASKWAKRVERAASDWAKYDNRRADGAKDLEKAQDRQSDAQQAFDKAQAKIDKGRGMKLTAEQASLSRAAR